MGRDKVKKEKNNKNHLSMVHSIGGHVSALAFSVIILTAVIMLICIVPIVQSEVIELNKNYLMDLAETSGETIDDQISFLGDYRALNGMSMKRTIGDVGISGIESSYTYVLDPSGTILYHPSLDMIGQTIEDEAASQVIAEVATGSRPEPGLIEYDANGVHKYAAYYVGTQMNHILIVTADKDELLERVEKIIIVAIVGAVLALAISVLLSLIVANMIVRPIKEITEQVSKLGHLDFKTDVRLDKLAARKDEAGIMAKAVKQLQEQLQNVLKDLKGQSQILHDASDEMSASAQKSTDAIQQVDKAVYGIADGATLQAQKTQDATENVVLMGDMIESTGKEVDALKSNISEMGEHGNHALQILAELEQINQKTKEAIKEISNQTYQTNESALEIKNVTTLISDIAEETNLLSLNASIEAARAGEHGRGFAVVAAQIQKLAEQSNDSAKQIDNIISLLISASDRSVEVMKEVNSVVDKQNENVLMTEQAFESVKQGIDRSMSGIDVIADRTQKLDLARVKVVDVVQSLTVIAESNAASAEETSASVTEVGRIINDVAKNADYLTNTAQTLEESVQLFQVDE